MRPLSVGSNFLLPAQLHIAEISVAFGILEELHKTVDKLEETPIYDRIFLLQSLRGVGFLSAVVLIAEMGSFDLFSSPKKLYAYFA